MKARKLSNLSVFVRERNQRGSNLETVQGTESAHPSQSKYLRGSCPNTVYQKVHSVDEPHPAEKAYQKGNVPAWEAEITVITFCTCLL